MSIIDLKIVKNKEIQYNWNSWNQLQNTFNLHTIDNNLKYPKHLIIEVYKLFIEECKELHIDFSVYKFIEVSKWDCEYQVDFFTNEECEGRSFSFYRIYYDSKNKKILQSEFGLG